MYVHFFFFLEFNITFNYNKKFKCAQVLKLFSIKNESVPKYYVI